MQQSLFDLPSPVVRRRPITQAAEPSVPRVSAHLEAGRAAEYLVCADLILNGWTAFLTDQGVPYDLLVDTSHERVRVQVKATLSPKCPGNNQERITPAYFFHPRRVGKRGTRKYGDNEFDIYAFVALDRRQVAYFALAELPKQCLVIRIPGIHYGSKGRGSREFDGATFDRALQVWRIASGVNLSRFATQGSVLNPQAV